MTDIRWQRADDRRRKTDTDDFGFRPTNIHAPASVICPLSSVIFFYTGIIFLMIIFSCNGMISLIVIY